MRATAAAVEPEAYLRVERTAEVRSELIGGQVVAMAGGSAAHSTVKANLIFLSVGDLQPRGCRVFDSDLKIKTPSGDFLYPDASWACTPSLAHDGLALLNPQVVFEVLSPSTEAFDRHQKFDIYAEIPSLTEIVLISTARRMVEVFHRIGAEWHVTASQSGDAVAIPSMRISWPVDAIYAQSGVPIP